MTCGQVGHKWECGKCFYMTCDQVGHKWVYGKQMFCFNSLQSSATSYLKENINLFFSTVKGKGIKFFNGKLSYLYIGP